MLAAVVLARLLAPLEGPERPVSDAIVVEPGATCLEHAQLAAQVETWLGQSAINERVAVEVHGDPSRPRVLHFQVRIDDRVAAERPFDPAPEACSALHAAVGLAIAIAIDATILEPLGVDVSPPAIENDKEPPAAEPAPLPAPTPVTQPPPPERVTELTLDAATVVSFGWHGERSGGVGGQLALRYAPLRWLELGAIGLGSASMGQPLGDGRLHVALGAGGASVCARWKKGWALLGCVTGLAGMMYGWGEGFTVETRDRSPFVALLLGPALHMPLGSWLALRAGVDLGVMLVRPRFVVTDLADTVVVRSRQTPPIGASGSLGLAFRLF